LLLTCSELSIFRAFVNIKFEDTLLDYAVRKVHFPVAMLDATAPFSLIYAPVSPFHFTITITFIFSVLTFILVPAGPSEHAIAMLLVVEVITFILIAWLRTFRTLPATFAVL